MYGGLIGSNYGLVSECINEGEIIGIYANVGGIVGENYGTITDCSNSGTLSTGSGCRGGIAGINRSGRVSGINYSGKIAKCANIGNTSTSVTSGGIVGVNEALVEECYNTGIIGKGGICIENSANGIIKNCYNIHKIPGRDAWTAGIAGKNSGKITNCYNLGTAINGLIGNNTKTMEYCYYLSGTSTKMQIDSSTGTAENCGEKSDTDLKSTEFLNLLNTGNTEPIYVEDVNNINNGYPILKWQQE